MTYVAMKWRNDGRSSAKQLMTYISDAEKTNGVVVAKNLTSLDTAVAEMEATIANSKSTGKAIRHIIVSQPHGENPTPEQFGKIAELTMESMGLDPRFHQYVYAVHYDTDNAHMHIMCNHVNPITLKAVNEKPMIEKIKSDIAERRIEKEFGFSANPAGIIKAVPDPKSDLGYQLVPDTDNAPYIKAYYNKDGSIDRSKGTHGFYCDHKHMARFLEAKDNQALGRAEREMIYQRAERPFSDYLKEEVKPALEATLKQDGVTWQDVHNTLRDYNVFFAEVDRGLRVYDLAESGVEFEDTQKHDPDLHHHHAKASDISYKFSKNKLEKILGSYEPPSDLSVNEQGRKYDKDQVPKAIAENAPNAAPDHNIKANLKFAWQRFKKEKDDWYKYTKSVKTNTQKQGRHLNQKIERLYAQRDFEIKKYIEIAKQEKNWKLIDDIRLEYLAKIQLAKHLYKEEMAKVRLENRDKMKNDISGNAKFPNATVYFQYHADRGEQWAQDAIRCMKASNQYNDSIHQPSAEHKNENFNIQASRQEEANTFENLQVRFDHESHNNIYYRQQENQVKDVFVDHGTRFTVHDKERDNIAAALILAADKFGGSVIVHGDERYRRLCLEIAEQHDITITNASEWEFYEDEREKQSLKKQESEAPSESHHSPFSGSPEEQNENFSGEAEAQKEPVDTKTLTPEDLQRINNGTAEKWTPELIRQAEQEGYDLTQDAEFLQQASEEATEDPSRERPELSDEFKQFAENNNIQILINPKTNDYEYRDADNNTVDADRLWQTKQLSKALEEKMREAQQNGMSVTFNKETNTYQVIDKDGDTGYFRITDEGKVDQSTPENLPDEFKKALEESQKEQTRLAEASSLSVPDKEISSPSEPTEETSHIPDMIEEEGPNGPLPFEDKMHEFPDKGLAEQLHESMSPEDSRDSVHDFDSDEVYVDESDRIENETPEPDIEEEKEAYVPPPRREDDENDFSM